MVVLSKINVECGSRVTPLAVQNEAFHWKSNALVMIVSYGRENSEKHGTALIG